MCCLFWSTGVNWKCWFWEQWIPSYQMVGVYDWVFQNTLKLSECLTGLNHFKKPPDATEIKLGSNSRPKKPRQEWLNETAISQFPALQHPLPLRWFACRSEWLWSRPACTAVRWPPYRGTGLTLSYRQLKLGVWSYLVQVALHNLKNSQIQSDVVWIHFQRGLEKIMISASWACPHREPALLRFTS